jgi:hypothetical protein
LDTKHHGAVIELISGGTVRMAERVEDALARCDMTYQQLGAATKVVLSALEENDVEGAAIGIAAVHLAYPNHDAHEYFEARNRIMNLRCPLLRLESKFVLPVAWQIMAEELMEMIGDGAERILAGFPLAV